MTIRFQCPCGKRFRAKDKHAGRQVECPICGQRVIVPQVVQQEKPIPDAPPAFLDVSRHELSPTQRFVAEENERPTPPQLQNCDVIPTNDNGKQRVTRWAGSPLSDSLLTDLKRTEQYRRHIRHAALWYRFLFMCGCASVVALTAIFLYFVATEPRVTNSSLVFFITFLVVQIPTLVLFFFAHRATWKCQRWAPMTMFVLYALATMSYIVLGLIGTVLPGGNIMSFVFALVVAVVPGAIAYVSYRAWDAIPNYRMRPSWCQEALQYCGL